MDTQGAMTADVPDFKLAKVGRDRRRKLGAGFPLFGGGGGAGGWGGALGGTALSGGMTLGKGLAVLAVAGGLSAAAWQVGRMLTPGYGGAAKPSARLFADKGAQKYEGDLSKLPGTATTMPNSLGYVSGSLDALTPEERVRRQAEAEAARKAAEEAQAKAAAQDAAADQSVPASSPAGQAGIASAQDGAGPFKSRFGRLGAAFNRGASALSGGAGLSGGVGRSFAPSGGGAGQKGREGTLAKFRGASRPSYAKGAGRPSAASNARGFAKRQLMTASTLSRQGATASGEQSAAAQAAAPFDNGAPAGSAITGPGVTPAGAGAAPAAAGGPVDGVGGGSAGGSSSGACGSGQYADADGNCRSSGTPSGRNSASYQGLIDMAKALMAIASLLAIAALVSPPLVKSFFKMGLIIVGGLLVILGAMILAQSHDPTIGGIVTAVGALTVALAFAGDFKIFTGGTAAANNLLVIQAAGALILNAAGFLAANSDAGSMQ